ncbi:hypothetical protein SUGI_0948740 [Cryptomeria japonica]|uniref:vesicle-associated protein 1-2 isoform X2 n=1 Tax=Cryptomeria japonica TaxID=3369 RepID=UPI0024148DEF|nr:vesicle-associated protein 1-2 isoform X2 [Cryptomeria japonica]GLJ45069.1 hypothetical protein SUGI_0948740 [Cryptomeria japonica]
MSNELVTIQPGELKFPFKLKQQSLCSFQLINNTDNYLVFKVKTTSTKKYAVRPNRGVVLPKATCNVTVTMQAPKEAPPGMQCKDRFLVQSVIAPSGATVKDITSDMFNKEPCRVIEENKLRVLYVAPPQFPSTILESSEEGPAQKEVTGYMSSDVSSFTPVSKDLNELKEKLFESQAKISKFTEEKSAALQQKQKLEQELALIKRSNHERARLGFPFLFVCFIGIVGIILGYYFHS